MAQEQKDLQTSSHGQEWASFYESFDKLVQDNLARSSDLLRRAMSLPEVADREVRQIRTEMEEKLKSERDKQRELLAALQEDLSGSHRQVSMLARSVGMIIGDLERLNQRVSDAIAAVVAEESVPEPVAATSNGVAPARGATASYAPASSYAPNSVFLPDEPGEEAGLPENAAVELELPTIDDLPSEFSMDAISAAVEEHQAFLDAAENRLEDIETSIDLNALAEAEAAAVPSPMVETYAAESAPPAPDAGVQAEQRPRPHWLSVTRTGTRA